MHDTNKWLGIYFGNNVLYSGGRKKQRQRLVRYEKKVIYRERKTNIKNTG